MITNYMIAYVHPLWLISTMLELALLVAFLRPLEQRLGNRCTRAVALIALGTAWHANHLFHLDFALDFAINIALAAIYLAATRRIHRGQALYLACVFLLCTEIGKVAAVDLCMQPLYNALVQAPPLGIALIWIALSTSFSGIALAVVHKWAFNAGVNLLSWKQNFFILLPLIPYTFIRNAGYVYDYSNRTLYHDMVIMLLLLSLCTVVVVVANAHNLSAQMSANELLSMQQLLREQQVHYLTQRSAAEAVNRRYHDLKHVIGQIERLIQQGDSTGRLDDLRDFVASLKQDVDPFIPDVSTGNGILDVLLTEQRRRCLGEGITPVFFVDGHRLSFINDFDLCTLIGNAIDNAREAVAKLPSGRPREFTLSVFYRNGLAIIRCQNEFAGAIDMQSPLPRTSKDDADCHGIGLRSIKKTAEKYDGHLNWEAADGQFSLVVMLPLPAT